MGASVGLRLRPFGRDDDVENVLLPALRAGYYSRHLTGRSGEPLEFWSPDEALALIEAGRRRGGEVLAVVVAVGTETQVLAGHCGIFPGSSTADRSIAFDLLPEFRGSGYARETCRALVEAAFEQSGVAAVGTSTHEDDWPMRRALEEAGFRLLEIIEGPEGGRAYYRISWLDRR